MCPAILLEVQCGYLELGFCVSVGPTHCISLPSGRSPFSWHLQQCHAALQGLLQPVPWGKVSP